MSDRTAEPALELWIWRHPKPQGAAGRCIGRTDLAVDARRAKRLAHRIRAEARRQGLPHEVWSSPLQRCRAVARWLKRWGWRHHVYAQLLELDFGAWDGRRWSDITPAAVAAWEADFEHHAPGGGESLQQLRVRVSRYLAEFAAVAGPAGGVTGGATVRLIVGHAGWINVLGLLDAAGLSATRWPAAPAHGQCLHGSKPCSATAFTMRRLPLRRGPWARRACGVPIRPSPAISVPPCFAPC